MNAMKMSGGRRSRRNAMRGGQNAPAMPKPDMAMVGDLMTKAMNAMKMTGGRRTRRNAMRGGENAPLMPLPMPNMPKPNMPAVGGAVKTVGTRAEVMHGTAHHTSGGLTRKDLKYNKRGRIVSRRASEAGKKALRRLTRAGYKARKGKFTLFKRQSRRNRKH